MESKKMFIGMIVLTLVDARIDTELMIPARSRAVIVKIDLDGNLLEFDRYKGRYYFQDNELEQYLY